jgi:hypothetical protein
MSSISLVALSKAFPSRVSPLYSLIHNLSAYSLAIVFAILMLFSKWIAPKFPKEFFTASWVLMGTLVAVLFFSAIGYFNTVGLEMSGFVLGMIWLSQFVGNTERLTKKVDQKAYPE